MYPYSTYRTVHVHRPLDVEHRSETCTSSLVSKQACGIGRGSHLITPNAAENTPSLRYAGQSKLQARPVNVKLKTRRDSGRVAFRASGVDRTMRQGLSTLETVVSQIFACPPSDHGSRYTHPAWAHRTASSSEPNGISVG